MNDITISIQDNEISVTGMLTQNTVMSALAKTKSFLKAGRMIVNLSAVTRCDSASLAYLIALLREAKLKGSLLEFVHMPIQMQQLGRVSDLYNYLPIAES